MDDDRDDGALLAQVAAGDMTAMRALYLAHAEAVRAFVRTRLRDEFEVADIVHETMFAVWRAAAGFQGRSSVRSWIFSLARNKIVDHVRKQSRVTLAEPDETIPDEEPDAVAVIAAAEDARRLRACVDELPERQRAVVHLAFFEDLSYPEIAEIETVPEGTVKTRIFHAKKLLMRCLSRVGKKL
ncbi:MAG: RNA polymerase sigma factor [Pseudomonadota bacterium]